MKTLDGATIIPCFARFLVAKYGNAWRDQLALIATRKSYYSEGRWRGRLSQGIVHGVISLGSEKYKRGGMTVSKAYLTDGFLWIWTDEPYDTAALKGQLVSTLVKDGLLDADSRIVKAVNFGTVHKRLRLTIDTMPRPISDFDPLELPLAA